MGKLSAVQVKAATKPGSYQDGDGLMLVVKASGSKSWLLRAQVDRKRRDFGLGSAKKVSLADARIEAARLRALFAAGHDPVAIRQAERASKDAIPTFREAAADAHAEQVSGWRNVKHRADWLSSLERHVFPTIGDTPVDQIDGPMVREALIGIWLERPETARRVRQRLKAVLDRAASKGQRGSLDWAVVNRGLPKQADKSRHFAAMDYSDVPDFVRTLKGAPATIGRMALMFTILTAARSGETRGAVWSELDLPNRTWTIPAERMKAGKAHSVPLSDAAMEILEKLAAARNPEDGPVFIGSRGAVLSDMTLSKIVRDMKLPITVHGFRSSFKDWASEATNYPDAVSEAALAHGDPDKVRKAYRRTDFMEKRRALMRDWGAYISKSEGKVVSINARKNSAA